MQFRKTLLTLGACAAIALTVASTPVKAEPVTMATGWFVVTVVGAVAVGAIVASTIAAKANECKQVVVKNIHGVTERVYVCSK